MKNREYIIKMLYMLKDCIGDKTDGMLPLLKELLAKVDLNYQESCLLLLLVGEYTRISGDMQLYEVERSASYCDSGSYKCGEYQGSLQNF